MIGEYNIYNILAAISVARIYGISISEIQKALKSFPQLSGRLEEVKTKLSFRIFIDFAHTPNSLENLLKTFQLQLPEDKRLILVFGCAGRRDNSKRSAMGKIATKYAAKVIITSEDPRDESLDTIYSEITRSLNSSDLKNKFIRIDDRREAIRNALKLARNGDIVAITGKGHEKSMCIGDNEHPWSDKEEVLKVIERQTGMQTSSR